MEKLCMGWGVQGVKTLIPLGFFFPSKYGSSISAKFLIYRAHVVCFCTLVTILDRLCMSSFISLSILIIILLSLEIEISSPSLCIVFSCVILDLLMSHIPMNFHISHAFILRFIYLLPISWLGF
jgi:hypothetical protein